MAEYVRRKRPPADHPYWAHRRDRAHPPPAVWPVAVPAAVGLGLGLVAGLNDPMSAGAALEAAGIAALAVAATAVVNCVGSFLFCVVTGARRGGTAANDLAGGLVVGFCAFVVSFVVFALGLLWFAVGTGLGPWLGMAVGAAVGAGPGAAGAWVVRRRWAARRHLRPRWEALRRQHRRQAAAPVVAAPPASVPAQPPAERDGPAGVAPLDQPGA